MTAPSDYKPQPLESTTVTQFSTPHEQQHRPFMDQPQLGNTRSIISPSIGQCSGCSGLHTIVGDIVSELSSLDGVPPPSNHVHQVLQNGLPHALDWVLKAIRGASSSMKDLSQRQRQSIAEAQTSKPSSPTTELKDATIATSEREKRRAEDYGDEYQRSLKKPREISSLEGFRLSKLTTGMEAERQRNHQAFPVPPSHSPPRAGSSPGSGFLPPPSPLQASYSARMLPSPSSLNFPTAPPTLPSNSSPAASYDRSAHIAHLQDLQRQISIKTLAYETLRREYDSLIENLNRQRTKCATLEKKFEVSDTEINSLTDEKERLQAQVGELEMQVEDLQQKREDERREHDAHHAQYLKILENASLLQEQNAGEKRQWMRERDELEHRLRTLTATAAGSEPSLPPPPQPQPSRRSSSTSPHRRLRGVDDVENDSDDGDVNVGDQGVVAVGSEDVSAAPVVADASDAPDTAGDARPGSASATMPEAAAAAAARPSALASRSVGTLRAEIVRLAERVRSLEAALTVVRASADVMMQHGRLVRDKTNAILGTIAIQPVPKSPGGEPLPAGSDSAVAAAGAAPSSEPPVT
ncbi:hypothetical protein EV356DRAFT_181665 [Viridothelium virens]|uniref:Uncharacterized protein n=1 Tax=Viridothelium virens TaxID=1048519 RepID=A0A6A6H7Y9_VIRVR|nr:hypothetical protein EV356DRAFT_181665 [Viridothelium virens]